MQAPYIPSYKRFANHKQVQPIGQYTLDHLLLFTFCTDYATVVFTPEAFARPEQYILYDETETDVLYIQNAITTLTDEKQIFRVCLCVHVRVYDMEVLIPCVPSKNPSPCKCPPLIFDNPVIWCGSILYTYLLSVSAHPRLLASDLQGP